MDSYASQIPRKKLHFDIYLANFFAFAFIQMSCTFIFNVIVNEQYVVHIAYCNIGTLVLFDALCERGERKSNPKREREREYAEDEQKTLKNCSIST